MARTNYVAEVATEANSQGHNAHFRLNPSEARFNYATELPGSALVGETNVAVNHEVVVEGNLKCGLPTRIACPSDSFRGVAAKLSLAEDRDEIVAELILLHRDTSLNLPVARSDDMDDLAADWQMWGKRFNLPLILIEPDGVEQMVSNRIGSLDVAPTKTRRPSAEFRSRRPRFLVRRKAGHINKARVIAGREIIARN